MAASKFIVESTKLLQTYGGRDKVIRSVTYLSILLSGVSKSNATSKKYMTIGLQLGLCRTMLRLFDDIPMLAYTLSYGLGHREKSTLMRVVGVLSNLVNQAFFPLEHIAWAADNKLINTPSMKWWTLSITAWLVSLILGVIKGTGSIMELQSQRKIAIHQAKSSQDGSMDQARELTKEQTRVLLGMLADVCDMGNAVHWMPEGFLWSNKLPARWIGLLGTISSLLKLGMLIESSR